MTHFVTWAMSYDKGHKSELKNNRNYLTNNHTKSKSHHELFIASRMDTRMQSTDTCTHTHPRTRIHTCVRSSMKVISRNHAGMPASGQRVPTGIMHFCLNLHKYIRTYVCTSSQGLVTSQSLHTFYIDNCT